jgi:hypothetical protein
MLLLGVDAADLLGRELESRLNFFLLQASPNTASSTGPNFLADLHERWPIGGS